MLKGLGMASVAVACLVMAAPARGETRAPAPPVQWRIDFTGFYEYDTNPLRFSIGSGDSHFRFFPSADVQVPLDARTTLFFRSALRRDQYQATAVLNGIGVDGSAGIARRLAPRLSVWGAYDFSRSEQPDVLQISPFRFASYLQQGGSAGLVWRARPADVLRADGFAVQRQYRGLSSPLLPALSSQIDPVLGLGGSWTHAFGGESATWTRIGLNTTWHRSNNPAYRYMLPSVSGAWGTRLGPESTLRLDGTLAWLRYDARRVGLSSVLRSDTIAETGATVAWRSEQRVEPFVRVSQQWDSSTDPFRNISDTRVLVGARVSVWARGQREVAGAGRRRADLTGDTSLNGVARLGPGDPRYDALAKIDLSYEAIRAGRWPEAAEAARAAVALDPANAIAWANLGVALYKLGDVAGARQALERSLALNPNNEKLRSILAMMPKPR